MVSSEAVCLLAISGRRRVVMSSIGVSSSFGGRDILSPLTSFLLFF